MQAFVLNSFPLGVKTRCGGDVRLVGMNGGRRLPIGRMDEGVPAAPIVLWLKARMIFRVCSPIFARNGIGQRTAICILIKSRREKMEKFGGSVPRAAIHTRHRPPAGRVMVQDVGNVPTKKF